MTKSSITRDELNEVIATYGKHHIAHRMAIVLLAAMDSEPVAEVLSNRPGNDTSTIDRALPVGTQLYRHAQPAPKTEREPIAWLNDAYLARGVVDGEAGSEDAGPGYIPVYREPATQPAPVVPEKATVGEMPFLGASEGVYVRGWNDCRAAMLQENPKSAGESNNCRRSEKVQDLLAGNCRENGNSSTNNCREIAETSTGTAITPVAPDKKLTDDVLDEIIAGAKTSMEQYLALSLKAEREVWRKEGPTDDERIMAIEGIHNCERCGDEGWVVGEMGIMRCACGQAGTLINEGTIQAGNSPVITGAEQRIADAVELLQKAAPAMLADNSGPDGPLAGRLKSPVIPDGYVMVPKEPTQAMCAAFNDSDYGRKSLRERYVAMLAAAAHDTPALNSVQSVATVPGKWVPVSERMPETDGNYWGWWSESKRQGPVWFIKSELQAQFQSHEITHWMPLPADPQEVKGE
ncbi:DUF551 domain-containing protein [Klebsiella pneumoniae]|nr:DUF551 domain-containing protein [Klebsiella pneumoniae]MCO0867964.1 DUF551 domain-containing protein [Klebsiella pneumoniae]MCO0895215.1 DUF551 domain-containing protein [Klebsiella pneumoniae]MDT0769251.1 DUF551 domain-containing protein [Klebsiella pneumoniae subsp. pneumoniae]MDU9064454.1 DUF551 domain-containing protein [Klebsiella pneumoniae]MDX7557846.1 DUF551 domain-containing protein [Klebsiella pneumoniae]